MSDLNADFSEAKKARLLILVAFLWHSYNVTI